MPMKCDEQTKAKAIRLVTEHAGDYASEYEAIKTVAGRLGMNPETLRKWLRPAEIDSGDREGTTTASAREIRELKHRDTELERTIVLCGGGCCVVDGSGHPTVPPKTMAMTTPATPITAISDEAVAQSGCQGLGRRPTFGHRVRDHGPVDGRSQRSRYRYN